MSEKIDVKSGTPTSTNVNAGNWANSNAIAGAFQFGTQALGLYGQYSNVQSQRELDRIRAQQYPQELQRTQRQEATSKIVVYAFGAIVLLIFLALIWFAFKK
ncbi:MAG: hypothetical protein QXR53_05065 [Candidatus Norongarragalinales archaeon]